MEQPDSSNYCPTFGLWLSPGESPKKPVPPGCKAHKDGAYPNNESAAWYAVSSEREAESTNQKQERSWPYRATRDSRRNRFWITRNRSAEASRNRSRIS